MVWADSKYVYPEYYVAFFSSLQGKGDVRTYWLTDVDERLKERISMNEENIQRQKEGSTDGGFTVPFNFSASIRKRLLNWDRRGSSPNESASLPAQPLLRRINSERHRDDHKKSEQIPLLIAKGPSSISSNAAVNSENIV